MNRLVAFACVLAVGLAGCHRAAAPASGPHTHELFGGKYFVEVETGGSFSARMETRKEGEVQVTELAEFKWAGGNKLTVDKGKLTFNGKEHGTLKAGDRVRVDREGRLTVNGEPRE
jgi:hypothetical protein